MFIGPSSSFLMYSFPRRRRSWLFDYPLPSPSSLSRLLLAVTDEARSPPSEHTAVRTFLFGHMTQRLTPLGIASLIEIPLRRPGTPWRFTYTRGLCAGGLLLFSPHPTFAPSAEQRPQPALPPTRFVLFYVDPVRGRFFPNSILCSYP